MTIPWAKTIPELLVKFVWTFVGRSQLAVLPELECPFVSSSPLLTPPSLLQSTQGNVVNFCYDRLRDNPTIAKHFVYLSHSHKSSGILKQQKGKSRSFFWTKNILVGVFRSQQLAGLVIAPPPLAASCADIWQVHFNSYRQISACHKTRHSSKHGSSKNFSPIQIFPPFKGGSWVSGGREGGETDFKTLFDG